MTSDTNMIIMDLTKDELAILRYLMFQVEHIGEPLKDVRGDLGEAAPADPDAVMVTLADKVRALEWPGDPVAKSGNSMSAQMKNLETAAAAARQVLGIHQQGAGPIAASFRSVATLATAIEQFAEWCQLEERRADQANVRALAVEIGPHLDPIIERSMTGDLPDWAVLGETAAGLRLHLKHQQHRTHPGATTTLGGPGLTVNMAILNDSESQTDQLSRVVVFALLRELGVLA